MQLWAINGKLPNQKHFKPSPPIDNISVHMKAWEAALLIALGLGIGAVAMYLLLRPAPSYMVRQYNNIEKWEIIKDDDGRVKGVSVHRDAKETA